MTNEKPRKSALPFWVLLVSLVTLILVAYMAVRTTMVSVPQQDLEARARITARLVGLEAAAPKHLAERFVDKDENLVADAPTDPQLLVDPETLVFSYVATEKPEAYREVWSDFTKHLSQVTGKRVEYLVVKTANDQLKSLRDGALHVTGLNTGNVPIAVNLCGFVPAFTLGSPDASGNSGKLHTEFIVPADSRIMNVHDLKGHTITFTDESSNSGFKAPVVFLRHDFGLMIERDYLHRVSLSHERSIDGIANHTYEAAAVASDMLERHLKAGKIKPGQYRTIYKSEEYPAAALGYAYNLNPALAAKIREAFTSFSWAGTRMEAEFAPSRQAGFTPTNYKKDWALIRRVDDAFGKDYVIH